MHDIYRCKLNWNRLNVCAPLVGKSEKDILAQAEDIRAAEPDLCEWRIDAFEKAGDLERVKETLQIIAGILKDIPILCTYRTSEEGGFYAGDRSGSTKPAEKTPVWQDTDLSAGQETEENRYFRLLGELIRMPETAAVDVEVYSKPELGSVMIQSAHRSHVPVIASNHDFKRTPDTGEIVRRLSAMASLGADVVKTAFMPVKEEDVETLIEAGRQFRETFPDMPMILISMGELGQRTRIDAGKIGSCLTFASAGKTSAPGQMSVQELREIWNRRIG